VGSDDYVGGGEFALDIESVVNGDLPHGDLPQGVQLQGTVITQSQFRLNAGKPLA
jgi:hypothetical protein